MVSNGRWYEGRRLAVVVCLLLVVIAAAIVTLALHDGTDARAPQVAGHVPTWAYDDWTSTDACNGGAARRGGDPATLVDAWVTYAESNCGPQTLTTKAIDDCDHGGRRWCTAVAYLETNFDYAVNRPAHASDHPSCDLYVSPREPRSWWLHGVDGDRLDKLIDGTSNLLYDQASSAVQRFFARYIQACLPGYGGLMLDDMGTSLRGLLEGVQGSPTVTAEISSDAGLIRAHRRFTAALASLRGARGAPYLFIDNGLSPNPSVAPPWPLLGHPSEVHGLIAEGDPVDAPGSANAGTITPDATGRPNPAYFQTLLDEIAYVDNARADGLSTRDFIVLLSYGSHGADRSRLLAQATEMLGYAGAHLVDWADLERSSHDLAVWPEEGLVPTRPWQTMRPPRGVGCMRGLGAVCTSGGHTDLQVRGASDVYLREFRACYDRSVLVGACAALVNDGDEAVSVAAGWLHQRYRWQILLAGGDVQSGGRLLLRGRPFIPGRTVLPADSAMLLRAQS